MTKIIELRRRSDDFEEDVAIWEWLKSLLDWLGEEGMSSDDTEVEDYETIYRIRILPWRNPDVDGCMDLVDGERKIPSQAIYAAAGSKPIVRVRDGNQAVSDRAVLQGLPEALYNEEWICQEYHEDDWQEVLSVSQGQFNWLRLKLKGASRRY